MITFKHNELDELNELLTAENLDIDIAANLLVDLFQVLRPESHRGSIRATAISCNFISFDLFFGTLALGRISAIVIGKTVARNSSESSEFWAHQ